ncbi:Gfo/Idh/MocA family oxidoreductase [Pedobacter sp. P351]|uniref:Gfo/Idh/MocA family protein n=1 Tax=Pedobacter superstes TaxID=3133441 RepID=UPI0030AC7591
MKLKWGIIGCGDVTEIKSGPAFNKIADSTLVAVMRRDAAKAQDYAKRHNVPKFYSNAEDLINDADVNAIYIATPPAFHEEYTLASLRAGKPVYVEKPMALSENGCLSMIEASEKNDAKLTVAHYRRALPMFQKVKELISEIGDVRFVQIQFLQPAQSNLVANSEVNWRTDPSVSGGGLFHDMAPHHIDLMLYFFGDPVQVSGYSANQAKHSQADDIVSGELTFKNNIICKGLWCFNVPHSETKDLCEIVGSKGKVVFPFHGNFCQFIKDGEAKTFDFIHPQHIQQPMIEEVVKYFCGETDLNPCDPGEGAKVTRIMDIFTKR